MKETPLGLRSHAPQANDDVVIQIETSKMLEESSRGRFTPPLSDEWVAESSEGGSTPPCYK